MTSESVKRERQLKEYGNWKDPKVIAIKLIMKTNLNRRYIKKFRKLGMSNYAIARALKIPENSPLLIE